MTDTQAIDVVIFDFKGTRVRCFLRVLVFAAFSEADFQMNVS